MIRAPAAIEPPPGGTQPAGTGGAGPAANGSGVRIVRAADREPLAQAERVIVDGFPRRALRPYRPECMLPPLVLAIPGWRTWLAYRDGEPAAACCTYDDGAALGIYWLATLPEHRSNGLGRAVMCAALRCYAERPAALVATAAGEAPLLLAGIPDGSRSGLVPPSQAREPALASCPGTGSGALTSRPKGWVIIGAC